MQSRTDMAEKTYDEWVPADYLREYYGTKVDADEQNAIRYFVEQQRDSKRGPVLCFGSGPTLHHVFSSAPYATALYLADYLPVNLAEIEKWRQRAPGAHDWSPFVRYTLSCELDREPTEAEIAARLELTRERIAGLLPTDAGLERPLGPDFHRYFSTVLTPFCAEAATTDRAVWVRYSRNIASLVAPGGRLLTAAVRRCDEYRVGPRFFATTNIDEKDLRAVLSEDFAPSTIQVEAREVPEHAQQGYSSILLARADRASST
jgi:hypothetical protein